MSKADIIVIIIAECHGGQYLPLKLHVKLLSDSSKYSTLRLLITTITRSWSDVFITTIHGLLVTNRIACHECGCYKLLTPHMHMYMYRYLCNEKH